MHFLGQSHIMFQFSVCVFLFLHTQFHETVNCVDLKFCTLTVNVCLMKYGLVWGQADSMIKLHFYPSNSCISLPLNLIYVN